jgi:uncharacterized protein YciI
MKQFIVIAYDAKDADAMNRRMEARPSHLELVTKMRAEGKILFGMAILDKQENMIGSLMVGNFNSREECDAWLKVEPYVTQKVWHDITVIDGKLPPTFSDLLKKE